METQPQLITNSPIELNEFLTKDFPNKESYWGDGLLAPQSITFIGGGSKIGKTIFVLNLALNLAQGIPFLGFSIPSSLKILLIQQEVRDSSIQERIKQMLGCTKIQKESFYYTGMSGLKLDTDAGIEKLQAWIEAIKPQVLILDPLYKFHNSDENSSKEMLKIIDKLDLLRQRYGLAVIIVHHHRKPQLGEQQGARQLRGSSTLFDYGDSYLTLNYVKDGDKVLSLTFELRNAENPPTIYVTRNSDLWYEKVGVKGQRKVDFSTILDVVKKSGGRILQKTLVNEICKESSISEATARRVITNAIKAKMVFKERSSSHSQAVIFIPDVKTDVSQMS